MTQKQLQEGETVFFFLYARFRVVIAHRLRFIGHINVVLLLNFDRVQLRTDPWSNSLPFYWLNSDPLKKQI